MGVEDVMLIGSISMDTTSYTRNWRREVAEEEVEVPMDGDG